MAALADVLVVMAKYPALGEVKTRLAERVGANAARALFAAFLADISARFARSPRRLVWAVTPAGADLTPFIGAGQTQIPQAGDGLAERMQRCFARLLRDGTERVVMIGADAPHIVDAAIDAAFAALDDHDAVFVPTRDGGYCLVGMRAAHDIFSGIAMGTSAVFEQTCARLDALGLRWRALETSFDVDEIGDVATLADLIDRDAVSLPRTRAVLLNWKTTGLLTG
jgi:hypothetical protein